MIDHKKLPFLTLIYLFIWPGPAHNEQSIHIHIYWNIYWKTVKKEIYHKSEHDFISSCGEKIKKKKEKTENDWRMPFNQLRKLQ